MLLALTIQHRGIALMQQKFHVIAAHDLDRFDAGAGIRRFCRLRDGDLAKARMRMCRRRPRLPAQAPTAKQQGQHQYSASNEAILHQRATG